MTRNWLVGSLVSGLVIANVVASVASAQGNVVYPWDEYDKRIGSARTVAKLESNLLGEQVNLADGALSFAMTDIAIPGNDRLEVKFSRSYSVQNQYERASHLMLADWDVDVPSISGVFAPNWESRVPGNPGRRCSAPDNQITPPTPVWDINFWDFWHGNNLNIPGGGELLRVRGGSLLPSSGGPYHWMTTGQIYVSCLANIKNGTGEGFLAITPDGTRYWFDWMAQYIEPYMSSKVGGPSIPRRKNVLYATRVEDRFGNLVEYGYSNTWDSRGRLTSVTSSDGRSLSIAYNAHGHISSVSDGSRTWSYNYVAVGSRRTLSEVVLPDGSRWLIGFGGFTSAEIHYSPLEPARNCFLRLIGPHGPTEVSGTIQHPSGALGTFHVKWLTHGRSNVPVACHNYDWGTAGSDTNDDVNAWTISYEAYSLMRKVLSGSAVTTGEWNYSYRPNISFDFYPGGSMTVPCPSGSTCGAPLCMSESCARSSETTVTGPGDERIKYFHGNSFRYNEGKLLRVERGSISQPLMSVEIHSYDLSMVPQAYPERFGISMRENFDGFPSEFHRPLLTTTMVQQGRRFIRTHNEFDSLARPTKVTRKSQPAPP
jgi:YD repeat-containing protein